MNYRPDRIRAAAAAAASKSQGMSAIEWTDYTFNCWEGCTKVSPGCLHCYAETRNARFGGGAAPNWGKGKPRRRTSEANWKLPLKWNRTATSFTACTVCDWRGDSHTARLSTRDILHCPGCETRGSLRPARPRVFCASLADWLDDEVPIEWLVDLLALIAATPDLDWQLLSKRPGNWESRIEAAMNDPHQVSAKSDSLLRQWTYENVAPANVWVGTSVEDQTRADERIPQLLAIPARVRFLSCEPLLGPLDLKLRHGYFRYIDDRQTRCIVGQDIHWVIAGGESGPGARAMHPDWARSLRDQCQAADVPFFFKQWGEWQPLATTAGMQHLPFGQYVLPDASSHGFGFARNGKKKSGRMLDGRIWNEFPTA